MMANEPPLDRNTERSKSADAAQPSRKRSKCSSSDSPSSSANNSHGRECVAYQQCSVLCHPLGLPLIYAFYGMDLSKLEYLPRQTLISNATDKARENVDEILSGAVNKCRNDKNKLKEKALLTKNIAEQINTLSTYLGYNARSEVHLKRTENKNSGYIDILLTENNSSNGTPYALMKFGLCHKEWWKKLDQNVKYLNKIASCQQEDISFERPTLFSVVTLEDRRSVDETEESNFSLKIGVFLCTPKEVDRPEHNSFVMSLLWQATAANSKGASKLFGHFLHVTRDFSTWIAEDDLTEGFEYLSSDCCKVRRCPKEKTADISYMVLRSYDNRLRDTDRNPEIYLRCKDVVGEETKVVLKLSSNDIYSYLENIEEDTKEDPFWKGKKDLLILATPFREGRHFATKPASFLPIIRHLKQLHARGYVHGDIRAFNTVFAMNSTTNPDDGWLIDFDFGGKAGEQRFPKGYKESLGDGRRYTGPPMEELKTKDRPAIPIITTFHDWYALGQLIFIIHKFEDCCEEQEQHNFPPKIMDFWQNLESQPTAENVEALESALARFAKVPVRPSMVFKQELYEMDIAVDCETKAHLQAVL